MSALQPKPVDRIGSAEDFGNLAATCAAKRRTQKHGHKRCKLSQTHQKIDPTVFEDPIPKLAIQHRRVHQRER